MHGKKQDEETLTVGMGNGSADGLGRRRMLSILAAGAAAISLTATSAEAVEPPAEAPGYAPQELFAQAKLRSYKSRRSSSWDRSGGNGDAVPVDAGKTATILDVTGAGVVTHLWFTINSKDEHHLKNLVLRAWWDGEQSPSIEVPIGDFFGLGLGEYFTYQSALLTVAPIKALNAYFQMPYAHGARITVTNEGAVRTDNLYFAADYVSLSKLPAGLGRFHAQYRQAAPAKSIMPDWTKNWDEKVNALKNLDGKDNYVFLEATGRGHLVGVTQAVLQNQDGWFGEGDDMFFIDGDTQPTINGTGTEDYFNGAWDFGGEPFAFDHNGAPVLKGDEKTGGKYCLYRWHTESPIAFEKSIRATIEHGHGNHRSDDFYSTAYWYQTEPHAEFPALPPAKSRVPKLFRIGADGSATAAGE